MTDPKQIPHLIQLLDDESEEIQCQVRQKLISFGPILDQQLQKLRIQINDIQRKQLQYILENRKIVHLKQSWSRWYHIQSQTERLETALSSLAVFLSTDVYSRKLKHLLDSLALGYKQKFDIHDPELLAHYLFRYLGFKGNEDDYYNPQNSNLMYVIKHRKGIPISLTSLYMLVGARLGLVIEGCPFPGHFLASIKMHGEKVFVDCFHEGQIFTKNDILSSRSEVLRGMEQLLDEKASVDMIVRRSLANLIRCYQMQENETCTELMIYLFKEIEKRFLKDDFSRLTPEDILNVPEPVYKTGQIVRHIKFNYRAIVVDIDTACFAADDWYYGNQPQPERDQPWYHVLVDGSEEVTYVAQSELIVDKKTAAIKHPLLSYFFNKSDDGKYVRNNNDWPDESDS